jgi:galacturonosyltransferase
MVLLEGASMAVPLIASNIAGCKEVIEHGKTGYVVKPKDANDLAAKMEEFHMLSAEEKYTMGQLGRAKIEHEFSLDIIFKMYEKTIKGE